MEAAVAKVAGEFDGEDALRPGTRADLDETIENLKQTHSQLALLGVEFDLPALDEDEVRENLEFIRHFAEQQR